MVFEKAIALRRINGHSRARGTICNATNSMHPRRKRVVELRLGMLRICILQKVISRHDTNPHPQRRAAQTQRANVVVLGKALYWCALGHLQNLRQHPAPPHRPWTAGGGGGGGAVGTGMFGIDSICMEAG